MSNAKSRRARDRLWCIRYAIFGRMCGWRRQPDPELWAAAREEADVALEWLQIAHRISQQTRGAPASVDVLETATRGAS